MATRKKSKDSKTDKKVEVSFTNWVLGGSLLSISSVERTESEVKPHRRTARKVVVTEVDSDGEEIIILKPEKKGKKDKDTEKGNEKHKCETKDTSKHTHDKCDKCGKKRAQEAEAKEKEEKAKSKSDEDKKSKSDNDWNSKSNNDWNSNTNDTWSSKAEDNGEGKKEGAKDTGGGWTLDQDEKIMIMKGDNKSWKDIALEVGASKKDVQNRHKEFMKKKEESGKDGKDDEGNKEGSGWGGNTGGEGSWGATGGGEGGWAEIPAETADAILGGGAPMPDFGDLFAEEKGEENSGSGWGGSGDKAEENNGGGWGNSEDKVEESKTDGGWGSQEKENTSSNNSNGGKKNKTNKSAKRNNNSGSHSQQDNSNNSENPFADSNSIENTGKLKTDGNWSEHDIEVLEFLQSKYEENKWLHMQAGFYNWTRRMVSAEVIKQKFKDDGAA